MGSIIAFFWYNKPSAQIYLGDAGALFIGGFLAVTHFFFDWGFHSFNGFLVPCIVLAIPLLESFSLIVIRTYKGKLFYYGSPDHYCLYLTAKGWSKNEILFFSGLVAFVLFAFSYFVAFGQLNIQQIVTISVAGFFFMLLLIFSSFFSRHSSTKSVAFCRERVAKSK